MATRASASRRRSRWEHRACNTVLLAAAFLTGACAGRAVDGAGPNQSADAGPSMGTVVPPPAADAGVSTTAPPDRFVVTAALANGGSGRITSDPPGIDCPGACTLALSAGSTVTLSAQAGPDSTFTGWGGACTGSGACVLSPTAAVDVRASFFAISKPDVDATGCDGLEFPGRAGAPIVARMLDGQGSDDACLEGASDAQGHVAVGIEHGEHHSAELLFSAADGTVLGHQSFPSLRLYGDQVDGYAAQGMAGGACCSFFVALAPDGSTLREQQFPFESAAADDPLGGVVLWSWADDDPDGAAGQLSSFDAAGNRRWEVPFVGPGPFATVGVDRSGNILVLFVRADDRSQTDGFWFSHDGQQRGSGFPAFQVSTPTHPPLALVPRARSGFFLQFRNHEYGDLSAFASAAWVATIEALATRPSSLPDWLSSRQGTDLRLVHAGMGFAVVPVEGQKASPCEQAIEILALDGRSCGRAIFPIDEEACTTQSLTVGRDGTVIQVRPVSRESCVGIHCDCTWHWWSGYFR